MPAKRPINRAMITACPVKLRKEMRVSIFSLLLLAWLFIVAIQDVQDARQDARVQQQAGATGQPQGSG